VDVRSVGESGLLVEVADAIAALELATWLRERTSCDEVVPAARTVLLDGVRDRDRVRALLEGWQPGGGRPEGPLVELPVVYDGVDLDRVAELWSTDPPGVARTLGELELVAAFSGFAPGFSYLSGLPAELAVPRLASPRPRVPAGSVAIADTWCGVYPSASPGGWLLVGRTDAVTWDPARDRPALLAPGTRVRLRPVEAERP
jgi:KipI family sensor histidine kinase inhibitor